MRLLPVLLLVLPACAPDVGPPVWALDPIFAEPAAVDGMEGTPGVHGFESWELFGDGWSRHYRSRYYVCSVVVELTGAPTDPPAACAGCGTAWTVATHVVETDCDGTVGDDPSFTSLRGLALGDPPQDPPLDAPYPDLTHGAWANYGDGWTSYGWAYPDALDHGGDGPAQWDDDAAFAFVPVWVWDL